jgi:hypothetical protein
LRAEAPTRSGDQLALEALDEAFGIALSYASPTDPTDATTPLSASVLADLLTLLVLIPSR